MTRKIILLTGILFVFMASHIFGADSQVRLNSVGFLPNNDKGASVSAAVTSFTINNATTNAVVWTSTAANITGPVTASDSNETVYKLNFSAFTTPGTYYLNAAGVGRSVNFTIAENVYNDTYVTAYKAMYYWRCGMAVSAVTNGQTFGHGACHMNDGNLTYFSGSNTIKEGRQGWHDAGDFNKYIVNAGITMGMFFMAWEHYGSVLNSIPMPHIPSTVPGYSFNVSAYPDYLKELRWEMDWVLKMQHPDGSGKVSHKLTATGFCGFIMPENDSDVRYYTDWGSAATADFVAMCAMAARVFYPYDPAYAQQCLDAAWVSYNFLLANTANKAPTLTAFSTGGYGTTDGDDRLWAASEMWATTGSTTAHNDFITRANGYTDKTDEDFDWGNVKNLGMYTYLLCTRTGKNTAIRDDIQADLIADANAAVTKKNNHAYARPLGTNFYWGCNGSVARQTMLLQIANMVSPNANYVNAALDSLSYLLGRNPFRRSYVTGIGASPPMYPHDRTSGADGIANPVPGYLVGGSNGTNSGDPALSAMPAGLGAAMYWTDDQDSYASNEIAINWQGALVYALAGFVKNPATPTPTATGTHTHTYTSTITPGGPTFTYTYTPTATNTATQTPTPMILTALCSEPNLIIDGALNDPCWSTGTWMAVTRVVEGAQTAGTSARFKVRYDTIGLTVGVEVTDPALFNDSGATWYNDDSVEVYIDANNDKTAVYGADDHQFSVRYNEGILREQDGNVGGASADTVNIAGGYTVEFDIPWSDLGLTPAQGLKVGIDIGVNFDQNGTGREFVLMYNGTNNNWQNTSAFGEVTLGAACAATPTNTFTNTATHTSTRTSTNTYTHTATNTNVPPTFTHTNTPSSTHTNTATSTNSPVNTQTHTSTYTFTHTATQAYSFTSTITNTPSETVTTGAPTFTFTPVFTATYTFTSPQTGTNTAVPVFTNTFTSTNTVSIPTGTFTRTSTPVNTVTWTPTRTYTATFTHTVNDTATFVPTATFTNTVYVPPVNTPVPLATPTFTHVPDGDAIKITDVLVYPHPLNGKDDIRFFFNLEKSTDSVYLKVYSSAFRLIKNVKIAGPCTAGNNYGKASKALTKELANGTYYFILEGKNGNEKGSSKIDKLIILK